ncbi:protein of unknown function [Saccharopolyspora antimicrobica]|uniref:Uncharacterized protein DUF397 n=1 Tax=Saccharopolyspora antimicrobica TaxID=455193 RepID=A0A1I4XTL9_9PSEU|nr:DUF397 domain-containing protein [Saccharopolyspora antimicrobica]RKT84624.1 uncharacterized protein DUF397 [Saccharopolyspora antimicrobica]SFN28640.1 protein of unknown function [Saccharopolyspora antimicrobica]
MYAVDLTDVRWRKSSRTGGGNNGNCVEVAFADVEWRKSSRSVGSGQGGNCVEVAFAGPAVAVRDSKDPDGPVLAFPASSWASFLARIGDDPSGA